MKIALLFSGQGSQYVGMGKKYYNEFKTVKTVFDIASESLGKDLTKLCFNGPAEDLMKTKYAQPAILTMSVSMYRLYKEKVGIEPKFFAGHSLGELSALTCAGAIEFEDAVRLVHKRGILMQEAVPVGEGGMKAVLGIDQDIVRKECERITEKNSIVEVANYNSINQIVISGHNTALEKITKKLEELGGYIIPLKVSAPFHCQLMSGAKQKFAEELYKYNFQEFKTPVISNINGVPYTNSEEILENLSLHLVKPVQWQKTMEYLNGKGIDMFIEIGPKTVLKDLVKKNNSKGISLSMDVEDDFNNIMTLKNSMSNRLYSNESKNVLEVLRVCLTEAVCAKNNNDDISDYNEKVIKPYNELFEIKEKALNHEIRLDESTVSKAVKKLEEVIEGKKVSQQKQVTVLEKVNKMVKEFDLVG